MGRVDLAKAVSMSAEHPAAQSQHATPEEWDEWLTLYGNRESVAGAYATLLDVWPMDWPGWRELNESILRRWSPAGLRYIKEKAWKLAMA
jgi:hypothetical protein